jgi:hypothetical protein
MTTKTLDGEMKLLEQMGHAEAAPEPGTLTANSVVHHGDGELPASMTMARLESAGYVYIYDTRTGERSLTNRNMLPMQLKKLRPDGAPFFSVKNPGITPKRGTFKCLLHTEHADRPRYDAMGLPTCRKADIPSPYDVQRHMEHRHRVEWGAIEKDRKDREREEERAFQRGLLTAAMQKVRDS